MNIEECKKAVFSDDWEVAKKAYDNLIKIGGDEVVFFLIGLLELNNPGIRNRASLALRDLKDNRAVNPLIRAIFQPRNINYNGTMVYALEELDCEKDLVNIFKILFYQGYEAKMGAYSILSKQEFKFRYEDLLLIQKMWKECCADNSKGEGFDVKDTKLMMLDCYEGFMEYLN